MLHLLTRYQWLTRGWVPDQTAVLMLVVGGCGGTQPAGPEIPSNPESGQARYIGSATCRSCHPQIGESHANHGHSQALKRIEGGPPSYPEGVPAAAVPQPPAGLSWDDISYVIGGYLKAANFVDQDGFTVIQADSQQPFTYHLEHPLTGTEAGFDAVGTNGLGRAEYGFTCFQCHTTGGEPVSLNGGRRQGNRAGIGGTWAEDGVQCEACHGPGSLHVPNPQLGNIRLEPSAAACGACHGYGGGDSPLLARDGFIIGNQQLGEVLLSPHAGFSCTVCHDPHVSAGRHEHQSENEGPKGIRNACSDCHAAIGLAGHEGKIFVQGDYVEQLECRSCHMPFASKNASMASEATTGGLGGRIGDTHTHIIYINTAPDDFRSLFGAEGGEVIAGLSGRVAVTLDYVCLRCHNGLGSAFPLTLRSAGEIAQGIHRQH